MSSMVVDEEVRVADSRFGSKRVWALQPYDNVLAQQLHSFHSRLRSRHFYVSYSSWVALLCQRSGSEQQLDWMHPMI